MSPPRAGSGSMWQPLRDVRQYVFLDECGVTTDLLRRYGRSAAGQALRTITRRVVTGRPTPSSPAYASMA